MSVQELKEIMKTLQTQNPSQDFESTFSMAEKILELREGLKRLSKEYPNAPRCKLETLYHKEKEVADLREELTRFN